MRSSRTTSGSAAQEVTNGEGHVVPCDKSLPPYKGRQRSDTKMWPGLAVILAADAPSRYVIGYRHRTLLVAAATLRYASSEEVAAAEVVGE